MIICPFCNAQCTQAVADQILIIDGECPSSCDDGVQIRVNCPDCGKPMWTKTIAQDYASRDTWPDWVEIVSLSREQTRDGWDDDVYLVPVENAVEIWRRGDMKPLCRLLQRPVTSNG